MRSTRRQFVAGMAGAGAAAATLPRTRPRREAPPPPGGFPADDYTPHGYLDNPYHSWALHPSGVIRSVGDMGFGFYYPAGPGGYFDYGHDAIYAATLALDLDPAPAAGSVVARHHSKNLFTFACRCGDTAVHATFLQVGEDTLAARVSAHGRVRVTARHTYQLGNQGWWGRDGLAASRDDDGDSILTRSFAAGTVFRLAASRPSVGHRMDPVRYFPDPLAVELTCDLDGAEELWFWLTRAANLPAVRKAQRRARDASAAELAAKRREDDAFWARAPRLEGDWPAHWRRGWVYDFETLRMMVRRPLGAYRHVWDAMQIQAPRNVLAETTLDMWALSYADPATAREVALGQFLDAVAANVPCMREDGSMNMVAADGEACGTSIAWCYPVWCLASMAARAGGGGGWLEALYAPLADFVRWTLAHRTDRAGYVVGKCSWETGMDASARFQIQQPTGAELIDFIRVVELQAATAHAAATLADWAGRLGRAAAAARWRVIAGEYRRKTDSLWNGRDWFQDFDTRSGRTIVPPPGQREVGQACPIFLGVASTDQTRAMAPLLRQYREHPAYYLEWPSLVLPYLESLWTAGERAEAAEVVGDIAERVYAATDRRDLRPGSHLGLPGVACEMWGLAGARGGEGYGWGATLPAHIIRNVVGYRDDATLHPNLPDAFMVAGRRYACGKVAYEVLDRGHVRIAGRTLRNHLDSMPWNDGLS